MKLLFISYHYPPSRAARSLQLGKLVKYLSRNNHDIEVITTETTAAAGLMTDEALGNALINDNITVHRIATPPRAGFDTMRAWVKGENFPGWRRDVFRAAARIIERSDPDVYDAVVSCAMPIDSHYVGLALKRRFSRIHWVAHFSDPWANNPYVETGGGLRRFMFNHFESRFLREADRVLAVSEELTEHLASECLGSQERFRTLHHVFDPEQYDEVAPPRDGPTILRYLGGFSARRRPDVLIEAVESAARYGANLRELRIEFVGADMEKVAERLNQVSPGLGIARGSVGYRESLSLIKSAHALLLIDADQAFSPYFPSKLADYFGGKRPIIAVSPRGSCTERLLSEAGGVCFAHQDQARLAEFLAKLCNEGVSALPGPREELIEKYHAANIAKYFETIVTQR